jgi:hypothetical protein
MKIKFDILDLEIDLTDAIYDEKRKKWWFENANISLDKQIEDLNDDDKKKLVKLAIYETYLELEDLANWPITSFKIK